jgi:predicted nucleic acid-binding protein
MKYYIDTCIWIDYIEGRTNTNIFVDCIQNSNTIILSNILLKELSRYLDYEQVNMLLSLLKASNIIEEIIITKDEELEALKISTQRNIPFGDALHAILARNTNATLLTRDKHFLLLRDICKIKLL